MDKQLAARLVSIKDFAQVLGVSIWTVRAWAYSGQIASNKLGARLMIPVEEIDRVICETARPAVSR